MEKNDQLLATRLVNTLTTNPATTTGIPYLHSHVCAPDGE